MIRAPGRHQEVDAPPPTYDLDDGPGITSRHFRKPIGEPPPPLPAVHPNGIELHTGFAKLHTARRNPAEL